MPAVTENLVEAAGDEAAGVDAKIGTSRAKRNASGR
jgi:hypothetical protein